jgi:hypothetical protein
MSDTARLCELLQAQVQMLRVRITAEAGIKEYEADWLPEAKKVMRDATGKFAKKGATVDVPQQPVPVQQGIQMPQLQVPQISIPQPQQIQQQVQNVTQNVNQEAQELKREIVNKLLAIREQAQNPEQVKENIQKAVEQKVEEVKTDIAEKKLEVSSELVELASKGLDKLVETNPEFTDKLLDLMFGVDAQEARDRLADAWEELHPELPNAIKPDPYKELAEDLMNLRGGDPKELGKDLLRAFNKVGYDYNKMLDDLNNMPDKPPFVQVMGKAAAMTIPIAMFLGATLAPEIGLGMLMGDNLAIILTNAAVGQFWSFAANKVMDKAEVDNPITRIGVDLLVGTAATSGNLDIRGVYRMNFQKSAKLAESHVDEMLKQVPDNLDEGTKSLTFVASSVGDNDQKCGRFTSNLLSRRGKKYSSELENHQFIPAVRHNPDVNAKDADKEQQEYFTKCITSYLNNVFKKGYNPESVKIASQIAAWKKKHPNLEINMISHCGAGNTMLETQEILKKMNIETNAHITMATPYFGLIKPDKNVKNILSENDSPLFTKLGGRNDNYINTVKSHVGYAQDPFFLRSLGKLMKNEDISDEIKVSSLFSEFNKNMGVEKDAITKTLGTINKKNDITIDELSAGIEKSSRKLDYLKSQLNEVISTNTDESSEAVSFALDIYNKEIESEVSHLVNAYMKKVGGMSSELDDDLKNIDQNLNKIIQGIPEKFATIEKIKGIVNSIDNEDYRKMVNKSLNDNLISKIGNILSLAGI